MKADAEFRQMTGDRHAVSALRYMNSTELVMKRRLASDVPGWITRIVIAEVIQRLRCRSSAAETNKLIANIVSRTIRTRRSYEVCIP